ncbi:MAG: response regulator transcription factor [Clostridia bacterium]|nr:response regulator transcription factor [Clostridia bacterium]
MARRILVCEDESAIRDFVVINLERNGFEVREAETGEAALRIFMEEEGQFHVALLDLMLPGIDGLTVCRELRRANDKLGIIMLTARTQEADKIAGLSDGADDYVTKPFSPSELVARVTSLCRRVELNGHMAQPVAPKESIQLGDFTLNLRRRFLEMQGKVLELTHVEFQILEVLFQNAGTAISRTDILKKVWGDGYLGEEKIVDVNIRRLRMKIEREPSDPRHLMTVWGKGYKWQS